MNLKIQMKTHTLTLITALLLVSLAAVHAGAPAKPNIIFILADDLGIDGVSCYGADKHKTPNIDKLAASRHALRDVLRRAAVRAVALPADDGALRLPHRRHHERLVARRRPGREVEGRAVRSRSC